MRSDFQKVLTLHLSLSYKLITTRNSHTLHILPIVHVSTCQVTIYMFSVNIEKYVRQSTHLIIIIANAALFFLHFSVYND